MNDLQFYASTQGEPLAQLVLTVRMTLSCFLNWEEIKNKQTVNFKYNSYFYHESWNHSCDLY